MRSAIRATYRAVGGRTAVERIHEAGSLRLRHPGRDRCEAVLLNTAGGVLAGDHLEIEIAIGPAAQVTLTSVAAEKIYRSEQAPARLSTRLTLAPASHAAWIPQETILFEGARLRRHFDVDMAEDASLIASEIVVFGRTASGEHMISGSFHDSWRLRRGGRLVFADETRLEGEIGEILARPAVAKGGCASALMVIARPEAESRLDPIRSSIEAICRHGMVEGGASLKDGIIIARFVARSSEGLRRAVVAVLSVAGNVVIPRVWQ